MIITRKIQLIVDEPEKEKFTIAWRKLRTLDNTVFRAANLIVRNKYLDETFVDRIILTDDELSSSNDKLDKELLKLNNKISESETKEEKDKLKLKTQAIYNAKKQLTTEAREKAAAFYLKNPKTESYHLVNKHYPEMPSYVSAALNDQILNILKQEWIEVQRGERSIRNYKKGMPIPFMKTAMRFEKRDGDIYLHLWDNLSFKLIFGRDKSNNREIVEKAIAGEYKYSDSAIQIKDNKIFLNFCGDFWNQEKQELNKKLCVGVDLGIIFPAYCALSEGFARNAIGSSDDLLRIRIQMQNRRRRLQKAVKTSTGGKGRAKKLATLDSLEEKEKNYVKTYNHMLSHQIIKFAKDHNAGIIKMELLEGYGDDEKNKFILRNWSYFQLQTMIKYKAEREGIEVTYIDPYHTSQTCAACGHYEEGQREKQSEFLCKNPACTNKDDKKENIKVNADHNAALNIARSNKYVTKKEECEYFKKKQDQ